MSGTVGPVLEDDLGSVSVPLLGVDGGSTKIKQIISKSRRARKYKSDVRVVSDHSVSTSVLVSHSSPTVRFGSRLLVPGWGGEEKRDKSVLDE